MNLIIWNFSTALLRLLKACCCLQWLSSTLTWTIYFYSFKHKIFSQESYSHVCHYNSSSSFLVFIVSKTCFITFSIRTVWQDISPGTIELLRLSRVSGLRCANMLSYVAHFLILCTFYRSCFKWPSNKKILNARFMSQASFLLTGTHFLLMIRLFQSS